MVTQVSVQQGGFSVQLPGAAGEADGGRNGQNFWTVPSSAGDVESRLLVHESSLATGIYDYTVTSGVGRVANGVQSGRYTQTTGQLTVVNESNGPFGFGWGISGLQHLVENSDGSVLLVDGGGSQFVFTAAHRRPELPVARGRFLGARAPGRRHVPPHHGRRDGVRFQRRQAARERHGYARQPDTVCVQRQRPTGADRRPGGPGDEAGVFRGTRADHYRPGRPDHGVRVLRRAAISPS